MSQPLQTLEAKSHQIRRGITDMNFYLLMNNALEKHG